jgi:hypothetical protein
MQPPETADGTVLAAEAARYLAAVDAFRSERYEPRWEAEGNRSSVQQLSRSAARVAANPSEGRFR